MMWLAPWAGKMKQILRCDLASRAGKMELSYPLGTTGRVLNFPISGAHGLLPIYIELITKFALVTKPAWSPGPPAHIKKDPESLNSAMRTVTWNTLPYVLATISCMYFTLFYRQFKFQHGWAKRRWFSSSFSSSTFNTAERSLGN